MKTREKRLNIGIDVGGTKIALGLVTPEGEILAQHTFSTCPEKGADWIIGRLLSKIHNLVE